ncbi:MAG: hypothetical protein NVS4B3_13820 [Gemmatimonadaceae bacterium]
MSSFQIAKAAAAALLFATACHSDALTRARTGDATHQLRTSVTPGDLGYGGPPPPRQFGPDSYRPGAFTGEGTTPVGLHCAPPTPTFRECSGFLRSDVDGTLLDVTVVQPHGQGPGPFPLVALLHGYGGSKNGDSQYNGVLAARGYVVLRYSARGFGDSWGQVNLADVHLELCDLQSLIGQIVDMRRFQADGARVAVFGASYGGGQSWLAALQPSFTSPKGSLVTLRTIVPIVPWTDLLYALRPNGRVSNSIDVPGAHKLSFLQGLFVGGIRKSPTRPYPNYPDYLLGWDAYILATEPNNAPPIGSQIVDGLAGYRSIWWQQSFWDAVRAKAGTGTQLPVFELQGFTDDLFPLPEALRMYYALRAVDPAYPITLYLGDVGHPRAPNKVGEVAYAQQLIFRWFDYYLKGLGTPPSGVLAAITRPRAVPFNPGDVISVPTYDALATGTAEADLTALIEPAILTFNPANPSGVFFDPFVMLGAESLQPAPPPPPPDIVPGDVAYYTIPVAQLTGGRDLLVAGQPTVRLSVQTVGPRVQLDVRLLDVKASATYLVTRGTYTLQYPDVPTAQGITITIPTYGNLWQAEAGDQLRLEITNVDSPYLTPSRVPSVTRLSNVHLAVPYR